MPKLSRFRLVRSGWRSRINGFPHWPEETSSLWSKCNFPRMGEATRLRLALQRREWSLYWHWKQAIETKGGLNKQQQEMKATEDSLPLRMDGTENEEDKRDFQKQVQQLLEAKNYYLVFIALQFAVWICLQPFRKRIVLPFQINLNCQAHDWEQSGETVSLKIEGLPSLAGEPIESLSDRAICKNCKPKFDSFNKEGHIVYSAPGLSLLETICFCFLSALLHFLFPVIIAKSRRISLCSGSFAVGTWLLKHWLSYFS